MQVGLLNVDGYYDSLLHLFDTGVHQGFIEDSARHIVVSAETAAELLRKMEVRYTAFSCCVCGFPFCDSYALRHNLGWIAALLIRMGESKE